MATPVEMRNELLAKKVIENLKRRKMEGYFCKTQEEAMAKALELIPEGSSISWCGSVTIRDMGLTEALKNGNYEAYDRDIVSPEEQQEIYRKTFSMDTYLTSANAISEDGVIVNIDGMSNRVAAIAFGPKQVIMIVGINKIAKDVDAAIKRARGTAAPINAQRFPMKNMPCRFDGVCHNCTSEDCICCNISIIRSSMIPNRIKVIIVDEEMGF